MEQNLSKVSDSNPPDDSAASNLQCKYCMKVLSSPQNLKEHQFIHTGEKPYHCNEPGCGQTFRQVSLLSIHRKSHSEIKKEPFTIQKNTKMNFPKLTDLLTLRSKKLKKTDLTSGTQEDLFLDKEKLSYISKFLEFTNS